MKKYILALDQGTTSSRAIIFNREGSPVAAAQKEFRQIFPKPGWVEHDPDEIWSSQMEVALESVTGAGISSDDIAGLGITNQRETTLVWDRRTGKPVYNAIVWQDRRTSDYCDMLNREGNGEMVQDKTGLIIDAYFSATKIRWILNNVDGARKLAEKGHLAFGTVDTWLIWKLTAGKLHVTDVTNASRTMLFNIKSLQWDDDLLQLFEIPASVLPEVRSSSEIYGETDGVFPTPVKISGIAGDQQAALFGQMCIEPGMVKNTYGTGCFMVMNIGNEPVRSNSRLLTTIAWQIDGTVHYALEGSIFIAGAVVQWLRDGLGMISESSDIERLASAVEDSGGVYFVPAFAGLGAPHWNQHARGTLVGITRGTTSANIARAALDSIAFQTYDVLHCMQEDTALAISELRVDGGATVNDSLMQFQADLIQARVVRPRITETTALGAAYLAGLAVRYWDSLDDIKGQWQVERVFVPEMKKPEVKELVKGWQRAIRAAKVWAEEKGSD